VPENFFGLQKKNCSTSRGPFFHHCLLFNVMLFWWLFVYFNTQKKLAINSLKINSFWEEKTFFSIWTLNLANYFHKNRCDFPTYLMLKQRSHEMNWGMKGKKSLRHCERCYKKSHSRRPTKPQEANQRENLCMLEKTAFIKELRFFHKPY